MFVPRGTAVVLRIIKKDQTKGGIVLPDERFDHGPLTCEVLALGPGTWKDGRFDPIKSLAVGDMVLCNRHDGSYIEKEGQRYMLVDEAAVLAIVREDAAPAQPVEA